MWNNLENSSIFTRTSFRKSGSCSHFIDGSNLFMPRYNWGVEIDYTKLLSVNCWLAAVTLVFYTGVDRTNDKQQGFLLWMRRGYRCQDLVQLPDGSRRLIWCRNRSGYDALVGSL